MELGKKVFELVSSITPIVNVDLLIKDENNRTLLSWRNDPHTGRGWHIPGGVIRFKETMEERIKRVSEGEIGTIVEYNITPLAINEIIVPDKDIRGHFISFLFKCFLHSSFIIDNKNLSKSDPGFLMWHDGCPDDLLSWHEIYRKYL